MREEKLSARQLWVAAFTGGLAPAAAGAGYGWQGTVLAIPVIMMIGWGLAALTPRWKSAVDRPGAKALAAAYAFWGAALVGRGVDRCAQRVVSMAGGEDRWRGWCILLLGAFLLWLAWGKAGAFFRTAEMLYLASVAVAVVLLAWGVCRIDWSYEALPAADLGSGVWAAAETGGAFLFVLPYIYKVERVPRGKGRAMGWLLALLAASAAMSLVAAGVLSPALADGENTFFLMTAALGGAVRVEGLTSALWLLPELVWLGLAARGGQELAKGRRWLPPTVTILGTALAFLGAGAWGSPAFWAAGTGVLGAATGLFLLTCGKN